MEIGISKTGSEINPLDAVSKARFFRLAIVSLLFVSVCAFAKLPQAALVVFAYFLFITVRYRLSTQDLLGVWLAAAPFLGPYITADVGAGIPDINFNRLFVLLLLFSTFSQRDEGRSRFPANGLDYALLFFLGAGLVSAVGSFMIRTPLRLFLDALLIPCAYYFAAKRCAPYKDFLPKLFIAASLALFSLGGLGLYEGLSGRDVLAWPDEHDHRAGSGDFRVNGTFTTAEYYGIAMVMLILFVQLMRTLHDAGLVERRYLKVAILFGFGAIAYTLTRGVWVSTAAGWLTFHIRRRPIASVGLAAVALCLWLVLQEAVLPQFFGDLWQRRFTQLNTVYSRIATYKSAIAMFQDHPICGVGFGSYAEMWERFPDRYFFQYKDIDSVATPHNLFLGILAEMGLVGGLSYLGLQIQVFAKALQLSRSAPGKLQSNYGEVVLAIAVSFLVVGLVLNFIYDTFWGNKLYYILLGTLSGMADQMSGVGDRARNSIS